MVRKIPVEDFYPKLLEAHLSTGHGGRDKMMFFASDKWMISNDDCQLFVSLCKTCSRKKVKPRSGVVIKPIISEGFNMRGQVDLIDFQLCADGEYRFLLNYQDHLTKFLHLRPLKSKHAANVADILFKFI